MAKNWYDSAAPTMELGGLLGMPDMRLTDEDKKRAFWQALMQGGMGMAAASLGGANTAQSLGKGLLGGADAYGQGLMAPQSRFDAYAKQLKVQGDQIGNAKGLEELGKLKREASDYGKQNDFFSMLNDPGQAAMLYGGGPTLQNEQRATQFGANPAAMLSDPRINLKALQARVDPKQLGAALENTRPYEQKPGMFYNGQYMPDPTKGIAFNNGVVAPLKGAQETQNALAYGTKAGELAAQLNYDRAKLPYDVQRAGQVASAEEGARFPYKTESFYNPETRQTGTRFVYEGTGLPGKANGISPRVLQEYQSLPDGPQKQALAKAMQLEAEGGGKPYSVVARGQMPTGPNQAQAAQDKGFAERYVKMYDTLLSTSDNERTKHQAYQQINSLLGQYEGGTMADTMLSIASEANRLGLPIDAKLSNKEAANAIRNQLMGEFKQMLPGPMSDADRKFLMSIPPSILNSSRGRQIMEEIQNRKAIRASAEADMAAQYLQKYGTIDINFERSLNKWRRENRMFEGMSYGR